VVQDSSHGLLITLGGEQVLIDHFERGKAEFGLEVHACSPCEISDIIPLITSSL